MADTASNVCGKIMKGIGKIIDPHFVDQCQKV